MWKKLLTKNEYVAIIKNVWYLPNITYLMQSFTSVK